MTKPGDSKKVENHFGQLVDFADCDHSKLQRIVRLLMALNKSGITVMKFFYIVDKYFNLQ